MQPGKPGGPHPPQRASNPARAPAHGAPRTTVPHDAPAGAGDLRQSPRALIELKVEYKKLNTFFADYTKNICKGGTFIKTSKPLDIGTEFIFKLAVPGLPEPLALRGEVRWTLREGEPPPPGVPEGHEPGMGIRFIYDDDTERARIEGIVERLMIDSLGQLLYSKLITRSRAQGGDGTTR